MQFSYRMDSTAKNKHKNLCELFALNASRWDVSVATPQRQSFNFLLRCDTSKPSLPSDVFQSVFSLQVLDVLSYGWSSAVLLRQMLLEPLYYCLVVIPEISLRTKTSTVKTLEKFTSEHLIYETSNNETLYYISKVWRISCITSQTSHVMHQQETWHTLTVPSVSTNQRRSMDCMCPSLSSAFACRISHFTTCSNSRRRRRQ